MQDRFKAALEQLQGAKDRLQAAQEQAEEQREALEDRDSTINRLQKIARERQVRAGCEDRLSEADEACLHNGTAVQEQAWE